MLAALSIGSCFLTTWAQARVGAFKPLEFPYRLANAIISYAAFIGQMFWPAGMIVQYVHKGPRLRLEDTLLPLAVLVPITLAALWFGLATAILACGLAVVRRHVGAGHWAGASRRPGPRRPLHLYHANRPLYHDRLGAWRPGSGVALADDTLCRDERRGAGCAGGRSRGCKHRCWQNSVTLWAHSVEFQPQNDFAQSSYADALYEAGRTDEANAHHRESYQINPKYITPRWHLAGNLYKEGHVGPGPLKRPGKSAGGQPVSGIKGEGGPGGLR